MAAIRATPTVGRTKQHGLFRAFQREAEALHFEAGNSLDGIAQPLIDNTHDDDSAHRMAVFGWTTMEALERRIRLSRNGT